MKLFPRSIVFLAVAIFAPYASAQQTPTLYYVGGPTGSFNTTLNWNTSNFSPLLGSTGGGINRVPNSTDIVLIDADENAGAILGTGSSGTVTIAAGPPANLVAGLQIANYFQNTTTSVDLNIGTTLTVTGRSGASGTGGVVFGDFVVEGGVTYNQNGGTLLVNQGLTVIGDNIHNGIFSDYQGSGTYNIQSGGFSFDPATGAPGTINEMDIGSGTGSVGTVTQGAATTSSTVTTGNLLYIGYAGGSGTYNLTNGSLLQTGSPTSPVIALGSGTGSNGTMTITGASTFNLNSGADLQVGAGGTGAITQNGAGSSVNILGTATVHIGDAAGSTGTYNLKAGSLNISGSKPFDVGGAVGATGVLNQSGGSLIAASGSQVYLSRFGTGTYNLSGGSANFKGIFYINSGGTLNQSGATTLNAHLFSINGGATYNMNGGSATFFSTGISGTLNLNGGTISVNESDLIGGGGGTLNFGGGTLALTPGVAPTGFYGMAGTLTGGTSTIDASAAALTTYNITVPFSGAGGISLIGNGTTFNFTNVTANSYTGPTTITNGVLNVRGADIAASSALNINGAGSIANLTLTAALPFVGSLGGNGTLNAAFDAAGDPLVILNAGNFTGSVNLTKTAAAGTLQLYGGTFGSINESPAASGSKVTIGGAPLAGFPLGTNIPTTGVVTFAGTATYTGLTTVTTGFTLNAQNLGGAATNNGTINITNAAGGGISGAVTNSGMLNDAAGIGGAVTNSGTLFATSAGGNVSNTGTLGLPLTSAIGAKFGITGSLSSNVPSTTVLNIRTNGVTADGFTTTTTAALSGLINVTGSGNLAPTTIVSAPGGITIGGDGKVNDAGGLTTSAQNGVLFTSTLTMPNSSTLDISTSQRSIVQAASLGLIPALTYNETQVASAIDVPLTAGTLPFGTQLNNLVNASPGSIPGLLDSLSPQSLQYARSISFENSTFLAGRMNGVCADLRAGYGGLDTSAISVVSPAFNNGLGRSLGSLLAANDVPYHPPAPNGVNYYPGGGSNTPSPSAEPAWNSSTQVISDSPNPYMATQNPSGPQTPRMSEFIGGDVVLATLNQDHSLANAPSSKASYTAGDATAGIAFRMTSHLAAGVLFDYNHTSAKTDSNGSTTTVDSYSPGVFATYFDHGFYANGLFSFGYNNYANTRKISLAGLTANSHPTGQQYVSDLDFGYDFHPAKNWVVGPTAGVTYTHLDIDSFTETGAAPLDLNVGSQSVDSLRSRLGGHVIFQTNTGDVLLQPNITAMWQHEYLDSSSGITSSFSDFGSGPFTIQTAAPSRDSALIGCGMTATLSNSMALYLNYLVDVGAADYFAQSVIGGFKARF